MRDPTIALIVTYGALLGASSGSVSAAPKEPAPVKTALVQEASVANRYFVPGTVRGAEDARLAAEISGKLEWVAEPGAEVQKGEIVARMDASRLVAERTRQAAEVRRLEAMLQLRRQTRHRQGRLNKRGVAVGVELDQAEAELSMAEQDLAGAKAALIRTQEDVKRTRVHAPFDGQVIERLAQRGEYPREGTPVVRLVAIRRLEVWADAPISGARMLKKGDRLPVRSDGALISATLKAVIQSGLAARRVVSLRLIPPPTAHLSVGTAVEVGVPVRSHERQTVVPRDAVVLREEGAHVMVLDPEHKVHRVPIRVGVGDGDRIAVVGNLKPGQTVILRGAESLNDGDPVNVIEGEADSKESKG